MHCGDKRRVLLEKFPPSLLVIIRSDINYCGKIIDSLFCLCLLMLFLCTWWLTTKNSLDKCNASLGISFQRENNNVNLICLYKSLEIMMIKIPYAVYRLFVRDIRLYWNK